MNRVKVGGWRVNHYPFGTDCGFLDDDNFVPEGFLKTEAPELAHGILRRYGIIKAPIFGKDLETERWIEECDWVYYTELYAEENDEPAFLCFDGLDTFCDIFLNGEKLAFCRNMHLAYRFDVTKKLRRGAKNKLYLHFYSPVRMVENEDRSGVFSINAIERVFARKAQMNYGWDFCGRSVSTGIWKDVYLEYLSYSTIESFYLHTKELSAGNTSAVLSLTANVTAPVKNAGTYSDISVSCRIFDGECQIHECVLQPGVETEITLQSPRLWWPRPYGAQPLYHMTLTLCEGGAAVHTVEHSFGIRTVKIIEESQPDGISFTFEVNGKRLFIRGANWVPIDSIYTSIKREAYSRLLGYAAAGNITMLRVWGGGIYEDELFFKLCDEYGIMVMQDFMFACGIYPQNEDFFALARQEAEQVIKKYRNYTSLAVWSGDNEDDEAYTWAGRQREFVSDKLNKRVLRECRDLLDPARHFMDSSPTSPHAEALGADDPNSPLQGDMHVYMCGLNPELPDYYKNIKKYRPRFMSEFGFVSLPEKETYYRFNFHRKLFPVKNAEKVIRIPVDGLIERYFSSHNESASDIQNGLIYFFQLYNSLALSYWIEYFRSLKWTCSGSLYWKFNDPVADNNDNDAMFPSLMSTVDFYLRPKMSYYFTRRAYEDAIIYIGEVNGGLEIGFANETDEEYAGDLELFYRDFAGRTIWSCRQPCVIKKDAAGVLIALEQEQLDKLIAKGDAAKGFLKAVFTHPSLPKPLESIHYFVDIKDILSLELEKAELTAAAERLSSTELCLRLQTGRFVPCLRVGVLDGEVKYSDNYFPIDAGQVKELLLTFEHDFLQSTVFIEAYNLPRQVLDIGKLLAENAQ